jgi:23S rRNA (guanosine2251-2'-O)-methyltransferase
MTQNKIYIYGKHAVAEALLNAPKAVKKVYLAPQMDDAKLRDLIKKTGIPTATLKSERELQDVASSASHQGVIGLISMSDLMQQYEKFAGGLKVTPHTALLLLDELEDPHNVGAVIRSAAAFGLAGVLIPERNQAPVTGAVVKVSAGMAFSIPLVTIGNVNQTIRDLKERGFWIYGLAGEGASSLTKEKFDAPAVFVLGNEGNGIREKTRELCDVLISIPINPKCESLNAAASAAVALYKWSSEHPQALK